ncbi:DUF2840 domain-containing protein [Caulobacter sp. RHG1]|uniref:DUF2840 domain-containing protein n=1 Tax=Caulobacter sp. (strain RHG1) TaxID=2545762 RepID=UPI001553E2FC|nr:DUF2840 domain-containing protein [Caulobacter sp. RHG1]NQE65550.1 hypothetical protein [Caulobacter sp. RHG1]
MTARTQVDLVWIEGRIEHWLRFGRPVDEVVIDRRRRTATFDPGAIFAFVRWTANDYGTVISRLDILRAVAPGEPFQTLAHVRPGGESLLRLAGWPLVERALGHIGQIEAAGVTPTAVDPDHWRHLNNRLLTREPPRPYDRARHRAWLHRRRLAP